MADEKWYFSKEQLGNTPSRKCGYDMDKELSYRQQAANFIQDMGQRLLVSQLCINTAIVYMHRFYVFHSFTHFHRNAMAAASLFLAAKVEEQPRKLEHVIKVAHMCLHREQQPLDTKSEQYMEQAHDLVFNENVLLQTLGFDVAIDHPHTHVVRCCHMVRASKDLAQTSYFMASNSLHLTTMCLQYKPTVVACFCIHLACKWSNWEIPQSNEGKDWFWYVDKTVSLDQLEQLTAEFLIIFDKCPTKLKRKIMSISASQTSPMPQSMGGSLFDLEPRKVKPAEGSTSAPEGLGFQQYSQIEAKHLNNASKEESKNGSTSGSRHGDQQQRDQSWEHREKRERDRERQDREKATTSANREIVHHHHHHPSTSSAVLPPPPPTNGPHHKSSSNQSVSSQSHHQKHISSRSDVSTRPPSASAPARDAARRDQAHSRESSKRDMAMRSVNDHKLAPPSRHESSEQRLHDSSVPRESPGVIVKKEALLMDRPSDSVNQGTDIEYSRQSVCENKHSTAPVHLSASLNDGVGFPSSDAKSSQSEQAKNSQNLDSRHRGSNENKNILNLVHGGGESRVKDVGRNVTSADGTSGTNMWQGAAQKHQSDIAVDAHRHQHSHKHSGSDTKHRRSGVADAHSSNSEISEHRSEIPKYGAVAPFSGKIDARTEAKLESKTEASGSREESRDEHTVVPPSKNLPLKSQSNISQSGHSSEKIGQKSHHRLTTQSSRDKPHSSQHTSHSHHHSTSPNKSQKSLMKSKSSTHSSGSKLDSQTVSSVSGSHPVIKVNVPSPSQTSNRNEHPPASGLTVPVDAKRKKSEKEVSPSKLLLADEPDIPKRSPSNPVAPSKVVTTGAHRTSVSDKGAPSRVSPHTPRSSKSKQRTPPSAKRVSSHTVDVTPLQFESPMPVAPSTPGKNLVPGTPHQSHNRNRTSSSSSEPELVPVVKKLDEIAGYENIIKEAKMGIRLPGKVPDIIQPIRERRKDDSGCNAKSSVSVAKDLKPPELIRPFTSQIPEAQKAPISTDLGAIAFPSPATETASGYSGSLLHDLSINNNSMLDVVTLLDVPYEKTVTLSSEGNHVDTPVTSEATDADDSPVKKVSEHHKSDKKKKKEKHRHKEKRGDDKKHKSKHKSKDKERYKVETVQVVPTAAAPAAAAAAPIKITIPKDKILSSTLEPASNSSVSGLKLKIPKDRLKGLDAPCEPPQAAPSGGLKLKISYNSGNATSSTTPSKDSRKREWTSSKSDTLNQPPHKTARVISSELSAKKPTSGKHNGAELRSSRGPHSTKVCGRDQDNLTDFSGSMSHSYDPFYQPSHPLQSSHQSYSTPNPSYLSHHTPQPYLTPQHSHQPYQTLQYSHQPYHTPQHSQHRYMTRPAVSFRPDLMYGFYNVPYSSSYPVSGSSFLPVTSVPPPHLLSVPPPSFVPVQPPLPKEPPPPPPPLPSSPPFL